MKRYILILLIFIMTTSTFSQTPVAVLDFLSNGLSENEAKALTDRFRNELFQYKIFDIMERGYMEEILGEQGFQLSGCTSDECVIEAGKLIGVEQMVGGSVSRVGNTYTIAARIINVESGKIINTATYDYTGEIDMLLKEGMKQVATKLAYQEPEERKFGHLSIISKTPGAKIYLNGDYIGTNAIRNRKMQIDDYKISFKRKFFFDMDTVVNIRDNENKILQFQLSPNKKKIKESLRYKKRFSRNYFIVSAISFGVAGYFRYSADQLYDEYKTARLSAEQKHKNIKVRDNAALGCAGFGLITLIPALKYSHDVKLLKNMLSMEAHYKQNEFRLALEVKL